ncbi:hypothetical protein QJS04_geneDACA004065 [Acorus gramineus]|uniref:Protein kinase domain-containing protein n=1 Tax=Acorus gramineus TaxID=55184 RepID=A0AAV9BIL5_ACOGR|nr:hypothetical protein QJS04_geneDACA004065 [Acorus gramineus]
MRNVSVGLLRRRCRFSASSTLRRPENFTRDFHDGGSLRGLPWRLRSLTPQNYFEINSWKRSDGFPLLPLQAHSAAIISYYLANLTIWHFFVHDIRKRAVKFRETLINLGPFYIKLGQALSTRPDILPPVYCHELSKLQDQIPPFPTNIAIKTIESQLGAPVSKLFAEITQKPVAAASLGQVYKAQLFSGEIVAVKVQRPGMSHLLTLDALLFHMIGGQLKRFSKARKDLLVAVNEMVRHMFEEIDYISEAQNAERFASLYASLSDSAQNTHGRKQVIKVPKIYWNFTGQTVLTMEWIEGIKLTDLDRMSKACLNQKELIDQGLYCSLRQLLEEGFFHADPHPGNLVATDDGSLAYFDFGMMGEIPRHYRVGLIQVLVHFVNRDSLGLANDFLSLGFLPDTTDIQSVADALQASFSDGTRQSQDFQGIMDQLYDVMYEFNFSLPPDYALVIRALGSLEGTAKALDPDFKVVESAYPFVIGRLLADPSPDMRKILRELLIHNNGSIRWNRFERLVSKFSQVAAISEQASESANELPTESAPSSSNLHGWKSFDMRAVVAATEDLFHFILSEKGRRVRIFLSQDIIKAADAFLQEEAFPCIFDDRLDEKQRSDVKRDAMIARLINDFRSLRKAVGLAPEVWTAMLIRMSLKSEVHKFLLDIVSTLAKHSSHRLLENFWLCLSRFLHNLEAQDSTK